MKPCEGANYDVATVFDFQYDSTSRSIQVIVNPCVANQISQVLRAACIKSEVYGVPPLSRNNVYNILPGFNYQPPYSLMYFIELERQGMPFELNRVIIPQEWIFSDREEAIRYAEESRDRYQRQVVFKNLKLTYKIANNLKKYFFPLITGN